MNFKATILNILRDVGICSKHFLSAACADDTNKAFLLFDVQLV